MIVSRLFSLLFHRRVFIVLGFLLLFAFIWFAGPLFAFAEFRPLAPVRVRLWLIGLILGLLLLRWLVRLWRQKRMNARLLDAVAGPAPKPAERDAGREAVDSLRANFERALTRLRDARFGGEGRFGRFGRRYVYQLPWYVFIGAPGSGKTTALENSGLRFPLADTAGRERVKGVAGTRSCDWWFAEEAVLLDTAGRYTTHESNTELDRTEWQGFLGLLKRFRPRQPINGAILTVSVQDLLGDEEARRRHAACLRERLQELRANLGVSFPVYLLVTKSDQLGGFGEYFDDLDKDARRQVWGFSLPVEAGAGEALDGQVGRELDALNRRLFERLPERLLDEPDPTRRARAYALPQNFAALLAPLREVLHEALPAGAGGNPAILRGVYFTSGTQDGTSFDRLLGSLQRSLGFEGKVALPSQVQSGRSYFLHDLLHRVILPEAHLAGRDARIERRERWLGIAGHAAVAITAIGLGLALHTSYRSNQAYVGHVSAQSAALAAHVAGLPPDEPVPVSQLVPVLDAIEHIAWGPDFAADEPPRSMRMGLYQGGKLQAASRDAYLRALEATLLPRVFERMHEVLATAPPEDLDLSYESLRVYLMLHHPEHFRRESVEAFVVADFERSLPATLSQQSRERWQHHLRALFGEVAINPTAALDMELVELTRDRLAGYSLAERAYRRLRRELMDRPLREFTFAEAGGPRSALVFARASGRPITRGVHGLFTHHGYHNVFLPEIQSVLGRLGNEEAWLMGRAAHSTGQQLQDLAEGTLARQIRELYLHEYVRQWEEYLEDLRVAPSSDLRQSREVARILASPSDSPLSQLMRAVARETRLSAPEREQDPNSFASRFSRRVQSETHTVERLIGPSNLNPLVRREEQLERIVDDRFQPIHQLVDANGGGSRMDEVLRMFNELHMGLAQVEAAAQIRAPATPDTGVASRVMAEAGYLPEPLRSVVEGLVDTSMAQIDGNVRQSLAAEIDEAVGAFCRSALGGRYPFNRSSAQDVTLTDFQTLFAQGGRFEQFFQQRLAATADTTGSQWVLRQPGGAVVPLGSFQGAARIREVFFQRGGSQTELSFEFRVLSMDAGIERLGFDFGGQSFSYAHGPQQRHRVAWPSPQGGQEIRVSVHTGGPGERLYRWDGPWALFRLFDDGELRAGSGPEQFRLHLQLDGRPVELELIAASVRNPFRLREVAAFSCPPRA